MNPCKYIVIAQVNQTEFLSNYFSTKDKAEQFASELDMLPALYKENTVERITDYLLQKKFLHYQLNGNGTWFGNFETLYPNTDFNFSVMEVNLEDFCLQTFVKERGNHSLVFTYEEMNYKIFPEFPYVSLIAN